LERDPKAPNVGLYNKWVALKQKTQRLLGFEFLYT